MNLGYPQHCSVTPAIPASSSLTPHTLLLLRVQTVGVGGSHSGLVINPSAHWATLCINAKDSSLNLGIFGVVAANTPPL